MNDLALLAIIGIIAAAWYAWRYYKLRREIDEYARRARELHTDTEVEELQNLSSALTTMIAAFDLRHSTLESERARLATVLDQITDGVLIADPQGIIQFANPAAGRLFQAANVVNRSITEVIRNHQLVEAWRRCQQTRQLQSESVELPTRHQYLQLVVIPDQHSSGSLLLAQDLTQIRRLEAVRRDFISNLSHELRTPLASLKALAETLQDGALEDPPAAKRFIDQIQIEVDALSQMVTELLELSRIESGRFSLELRPVAPYTLLELSRETDVTASRARRLAAARGMRGGSAKSTNGYAEDGAGAR